MSITISGVVQFRRDTAANWVSVNPVLADGEPGFDTTNRKFKLGPGNWNSLPYYYGSANPPIPLTFTTGTAIPIIIDYTTYQPQYGDYPTILVKLAGGGANGQDITAQSEIIFTPGIPLASISVNANDDSTGHLATDIIITIKP